MRVAWPRLTKRLVVGCAFVVATLIAVLAPSMATAATVGPPLPVTTYDASTHVYDGSSQHAHASSAADSRLFPDECGVTGVARRR